ncbi:MAG TPA: Na/Pi cotransporter family protein [Planctomycetaceae bacterium]|nr:Na/Pi cotransporter family protein [Planctomycetaceae bacterium]
MDVEVVLELIFNLVGGLGLFLLGMKHMSEGMQAIAGNSLRRMIGAVTNHRILATMVGTGVTSVVQSSSITTVMVIGFVNSGLMELSQAIGVIMGANIGTTITGWLLVLKIGKYGLPILGMSAFVYLFFKGERWRYWALSFMGVGMVFFGLEIMKDACSVIEDLPEFNAWFQQFRYDGTWFSVLKCAMMGCLLTMMVQSSSATLGITISLATSGVIPFETAAALVLGENIGTTITAILASLGTTTNARRAAYFHVVFNLIGVLWITLIFGWYIELVKIVVGVLVVGGVDNHIDFGIAATHTIFNIVNTLIFLPFVPLFARVLNRVVPDREFKEKPKLTALDIRILDTPLMAIEQSRKEIEKMGLACSNMLDWLSDLLQQDDPDKVIADRLKEQEQILDSMQDEVAEFITDLLSGNLPHSVAEEARRQLRMADEFESVSDYIANLDKFDRKLRRDGHRFTSAHREDLAQLNRLTASYLTAINDALVKKDDNVSVATDPVSKRIRNQVKQLRRKHLDDLSNGIIPPLVSVAFLATLNAYSRVRDHTQNIAEAISGEK